MTKSPSPAAPLLAWFDRNKRILPFRQNKTPYRVWVSEIMLQQTRVSAALPYYERFMAELPDVRALADCEPDRLAKLWEGLGYYSRARNLQKAGVRIPEDFSLLAMEYPSVSENLVPSHTTLAQNFKRLASEAVNLLEKIMNHSPGLKDIDIPYTLIERESVLDISRRGPDGAAPPPSGS